MEYETNIRRIACALLILIGCETRILYVDRSDASVGDASTQDAGPDTSSWYQRPEAYVGEELRLPVPEGVSLAGNSSYWNAFGNIGGIGGDPITVSTPPDGHLLIGYQNRVASFVADPENFARLEVPDGVTVFSNVAAPFSRDRLVMLPQRRTAMLWGGSPWVLTRAIGPAPELRVTNEAYSPLRTTSYHFSSTKRMWSATNDSGVTLVEVGHAPATNRSDSHDTALIRLGPAGGASSLPNFFRYRNDGERLQLQLVGDIAAHGNDFFRVSLRADGLRPDRAHIEIHRLSGDVEWAPVDSTSPWGEPVLTSEPEYWLAPWRFGGSEDRLVAAVGNSTLMVQVYGHIRFASLTNLRWTSDWIALGTGQLRASVAWDAAAQRFAVAVDSGVRFYSETGTSLGGTNVPALSFMVLTSWQGALWAIGYEDASGDIRVVRINGTPSAQTGAFHIPGYQQITGLAQHGQDVLVSWTDARQTFATRVSLTNTLEAWSTAVLTVANGVLIRDGDHFYVASANRQTANVSRIAKLNPVSLATGTEVQRSYIESVYAHGGQLFASSTSLSEGSRGEFRDLEVFDSQLQRLRGGQIPGFFLDLDTDCNGMLCAERVWGPTSSRLPIVLDLAETPPQSRPWTAADLTDFPICNYGREAIQGREAYARRSDGGCESTAILRLPGREADYTCPVDETRPGERCWLSQSGFASSEAHTLVIERRGSSAGNGDVVEHVVLRLFDRNQAIAALDVPGSLLAGSDFQKPIRAFHIRGGLFVLVYERASYRGVNEAFARVAYFPQVDQDTTP